MTETPDAPARFSGVQVLRFLAAALVVITHGTLYTRERLTGSLPVWHFGEFGVDIFFVISGFVMVVSSRSLQARPDGWKYFAVRRVIRIVPMYWLATTVKLLMMVAGTGVVLHAVLGWNVPLSYLFLPSTNVDGQVEPLLGVGWTLTFEMFFYALFTLALLMRVDPVRFCGVLLTGAALVGVLRTAGWPAATVYLQPRVLYFVAGMVIAKFTVDRVWRRTAAGLGLLAAVFVGVQVGPELAGGHGIAAWDDVARPLTAIVLVLGVVLAERRVTPLLPAYACRLGDASYSLYLFHPLIAPVVPVALAIMGWRSAALCLSAIVVVAVVASLVLYRWLERPVTRALQDRLPYVRPSRDTGDRRRSTAAPGLAPSS